MSLMNLYFGNSEPEIFPSAKGIAVLDVVSSLEPNGSCCADVQRQVKAVLGREPRLASLYQILKDLERKGLIRPTDVAHHDTGGRPRRVYRLTPRGNEVLRMSRRLLKEDNEAIQPV